MYQETHIRIFITAGLGRAKNWKKLKQPPTGYWIHEFWDRH